MRSHPGRARRVLPRGGMARSRFLPDRAGAPQPLSSEGGSGYSSEPLLPGYFVRTRLAWRKGSGAPPVRRRNETRGAGRESAGSLRETDGRNRVAVRGEPVLGAATPRHAAREARSVFRFVSPVRPVLHHRGRLSVCTSRSADLPESISGNG